MSSYTPAAAVYGMVAGLLALGIPAVVHAQGPAPAPVPLVFDGATVIDVEHGTLLPAQRVVIVGSRIQAVGSASGVPVPKGAKVVAAHGKFLIPGLWDMHAHTEYLGGHNSSNMALQDAQHHTFYPIYIAHGVTGLREMAQQFRHGADSFRVWQRQVMTGTRVGPRAVGPSADLITIALKTSDDARRVIDSLKAAGMVFLKYHDDFGKRDLFFAIAREARRVGLPLVGHVPVSVTSIEASDSGFRSLEHIFENRQCLPRWPDPSDRYGLMTLDDSAAFEEHCSPVVAAYIRNGTWIVPTLVMLDFMYAHAKTYRQSAQKWVRMMHRLGSKRILAGTDCATEPLQNEYGLRQVCRRGLALLQELVLLAGAGLTPLEALQTATLNPAKFLNATDSLGTVAAGKLADLVLLDADPLGDIRNVLTIRAVVANGRYFDRAALDDLDPEGMTLARSYNKEINTYGSVRSRGVLGIGLRDISSADSVTGDDARVSGVQVESVIPNSAAAAGGIQIGDIIVALDARPVIHRAEYRRHAEAWKSGQLVRLDILAKDGVRRTVDVVLGEQ